MQCNYFEYRKLYNKLFKSGFRSDKQINDATEEIRRYLVDGGAGLVLKQLHIGFIVTSKVGVLLPEEVVKRRFVWLDGEQKGKELCEEDIYCIGLFLKQGALYGVSCGAEKGEGIA